MDTIAGAEASAIMFSMAETLKANGLKAYEYFRYVLEEMPKRMGKDFESHTFVDDFLPWSDKLPAADFIGLPVRCTVYRNTH